MSTTPVLAEPAEEAPAPHRHIHFKAGWIFILASVVVATAIGVAAIVILKKEELSRSQFRISITLLTFALSLVSGVIFAPHAQVKGNFGLITANVAGPAALWLVALLSFRHLFPDEPGPAFPKQLSDLTSIVKDVQRKEGWKTLEEWKNSLGLLHSLFEGKDEEGNMRQLLSGAYVTGAPRVRPSNPAVQTLFFYPPGTPDCQKESIKLQRIFSADSAAPSWVFATATNTLATGRAKFVLLTREGERITGIFPDTTAWVPIPTRTVDALVVARYCEGQLSSGDWLQVHVPKYVGSGKATVDIGLASPQKFVKEQAWQMRASAFASAEAPVVFKEVAPAPAKDVARLLLELKPWIDLLRSSKSNDAIWARFGIGAPQRQLVADVLSEIDGTKDKKPFFTGGVRSAFSYHLEGVEDSTIVTFEWGD